MSEYSQQSFPSVREGSFSRSELGLLSAALGVGAIVTYLLLTDFSFFQTSLNARGTPIAEIISFKNSVKRRQADEPLWSKVSTNQSLYQRDHIYTDQGSSVRIAFGKDSEIDIEENALVILEQTPDAPIIRVNQGAIITRTQAPPNQGSEEHQKIRIRIGNSDAVISGNNTTAMFNAANISNPTISLVAGTAKVSIDGQTAELKANQSFTVNTKSKVKKITELPSFTILSPKKLSVHGQPLSFTWQSNKPAQISKMQILKGNTLVEERTSPNVNYQSNIVNPGTYTIQLGVKSTEESDNIEKWTYSVPVSFSYHTNQAPQLIFPVNGQVLFAKNDANLTTYLDWHLLNDTPTYDIQLGVDPELNNVVLRKSIAAGPLETGSLIPGVYYWRARSRFPEGAGQWSEVARFVVKAEQVVPKFNVPLNNRLPNAKIADAAITDLEKAEVKLAVDEVAPPVTDLRIVQPENGAQINANEENDTIDIFWSSTFSTDKYYVQVAFDEAFSKISYQGIITGSIKRFQPQQDSIYFTRVKPVIRNRKLAYSQVVSFTVNGIDSLRASRQVAATPILTASASNLERRGVDPQIIYKWNRVKNAQRYQFELAADPSFQNIVLQKTQKTLQLNTPIGPGTYYARVAAINNQSDRSPYSEAHRLNVTDINILRSPKLETPDQTTMVYRKLEPEVAFAWSSVKGAAQYRIDIAKDNQFNKIVFSSTQTSNNLAKNFAKGKYFWRVDAIGSNKTHRALSETSTFNIDQDTSRPTAKMPSDNMVVDFDSDEPRKLKFVWEKPADIPAINIVVAKDPKFEDVVGRLPSNGDSIALNIHSDGTYFWFIEGRDSKENIAIRSDIIKFKVKPLM